MLSFRVFGVWSAGRDNVGNVVCCDCMLGFLLRVAWCCVMWGSGVVWRGVLLYCMWCSSYKLLCGINSILKMAVWCSVVW